MTEKPGGDGTEKAPENAPGPWPENAAGVLEKAETAETALASVCACVYVCVCARVHVHARVRVGTRRQKYTGG